MDFVDIDSVREGFAIRSSTLRMELEAMLEKTLGLEQLIQKHLPEELDVYRPCEESKESEPMKKKMKY
jgi:hypothetical protein